MSLAEHRLFKAKKKMKEAIGDETINCPNCGTPVPQKIFLREDFGKTYKCKMCNKCVYEEWIKQFY